MPVVEVRNVSKRFRRGGLFALGRNEVLAVDRVSLCVERGEALCVAGESGSGKTTLARMLVRLERPDAGSIRIDGQEVESLPRRETRAFRRKVQLVSQNPYDSLNPRLTVAEALGEPLRVHGIGRTTAERRPFLEAALDRVELRPPSEFLARFPHELSGGQRQRVAIGRAILLDPSVMILDEPVSMLDVSVKAGVINLLRRIREETRQAQVVVTHDLAVARYVAERTIVMYRGRLLEEGPTEAVIERPFHPYTRALVSAIPRIGRASGAGGPSPAVLAWYRHTPASCAMATECGALVGAGRAADRYLTVGERHSVACCRLAGRDRESEPRLRTEGSAAGSAGKHQAEAGHDRRRTGR